MPEGESKMAKSKPTRKASKPDRRIGGNNKNGVGGFGTRPQDRNVAGQRSAAAVAFSRTLRELLVIVGEEKHTIVIEGKPITKRNIEWMIDSLWSKARAGNKDAVDFVAERVEGKVKDEFTGQVEVILKVQRDASQPNRSPDSAAQVPTAN